MGSFLSILLDIITILGIIILGSLFVVIIAELILHLIGGSSKKEKDSDDVKKVVDDDEIVVYSRADNPNNVSDSTTKSKTETIDGEQIEEIDYDKAVEEQKMLESKRGGNNGVVATQQQAKPVENAPANNDIFWDDDTEDEFDTFLDDVIEEAKNTGDSKTKKPAMVEEEDTQDDKNLEEIRKAEEKAKLAEERAREAEERARLAEEKALKAEEDARKAMEEAKAGDSRKAEEEAKKAEAERIKAEEAAQLAEDKAREAEEKAKAAEEARYAEELRRAQEDAKKAIDDATQEQLNELKALKEQQQQELEEFKQLKEDFAREKEEQLEMLKDDLARTKEEELERIRVDALKEQERLEKLQEELAQEREQLEKDRLALEEKQNEQVAMKEEDVAKESMLKDEEEINKLKYRNLIRMNARLTRIIRDAERLQSEKERERARLEEERNKLLKLQEEEKQKEHERNVEIERAEREKILKMQEAEAKRKEIADKLAAASKTAGKYRLDSKVVKISKTNPNEIIVEDGKTPSTIATKEVEPMKSSAKPMFDKDYYEARLSELEEELREAEKELRVNKSEYLPLTRIHKAYARDSEKLRKKEMQVAKQKVALYGVNSRNVDPAKKEKLDENLQALAELKDSVQHCEEVIRKNKDRYPILEKNNKLIVKQIERINDDIKVCNKAIEYYNKGKN